MDAVVEGSVMRAGNRVRITAELIDARRDQHLWGDSYNRDLRDTLELQNEVAEAVSNRIGMVLADKSAMPLRTAARKLDPQAYEAYLRGRYYWNHRTVEGLRKALEYFQELARYVLYTNPGLFYQALTLLKRNQPGDKEQAKQFLQQVIDRHLDGDETAREWVKKL